MPRWVLSFNDRDKYEGGSTFLNYHYFFLNYAIKNPNKRIIIRPHTLLKSYAVNNRYLNEDQIEKIFNDYNKIPNITVSNHVNRSLVDDIFESDVVISDGTSALAEVVVSDRPIIYLSNGWNNEFNSNDLSRGLKEIVSFSYNPKDIENMIDSFRNKKMSSLDHEKIEKYKKILDPVNDPADFISKWIGLQNPS